VKRLVTIDRTRDLAKERGISLTFICKQMGLNNVYFIDREKAGREIPDQKLEIIADVLFTTAAYLRGETDEKERPATEHGDGCSVVPGYEKLNSSNRAAIDQLVELLLKAQSGQ
jgi:transcriptional regulator with XRE-family HTH domain